MQSTARPQRFVFSLVHLILISIILFSLSRLSPVVTAQTATFRNPLNNSGPDPWMLYYNGNYYLAATTWGQSASVGLTMRRASTIAGLKAAAPVQVWQDTTPARCCQMWAPEFHLLSGPNGTRWYMYYTAGTSGACCDNQRLHVLESAGTDPMGPYTYRSQLLPGWAIDGSLLKVGSTLYLLFSQWQGADQGVYIIQLSNPWTTTGSATRITYPTFSWETQGGRTDEGPVALYHGSDIFIIFSASSCNTPDYKLGQLKYTGTNPLSAGAWTKNPNPVFQRSDANGVYGPGHNGFFKSPDGTEDWIVYHANNSTGGGCDMNRTPRIQKFTWNADGSPNFGTPVSTNTDLTVPSGEIAGPTPTRTNTPSGPTATPTRTPTPGASYQIINRNSNKCLDVSGASTADGANIAQWTCNGGSNQRWRTEDLGNGYVRLVAVHSNKVADVANCGTGDGADIRQWSWLNNTCQQWQLVTTTSPWFRLVNRNSSKVADVANCGTGDGVDVRQWTWLNNNCQQWQLVP